MLLKNGIKRPVQFIIISREEQPNWKIDDIAHCDHFLDETTMRLRFGKRHVRRYVAWPAADRCSPALYHSLFLGLQTYCQYDRAIG